MRACNEDRDRQERDAQARDARERGREGAEGKVQAPRVRQLLRDADADAAHARRRDDGGTRDEPHIALGPQGAEGDRIDQDAEDAAGNNRQSEGKPERQARAVGMKADKGAGHAGGALGEDQEFPGGDDQREAQVKPGAQSAWIDPEAGPLRICRGSMDCPLLPNAITASSATDAPMKAAAPVGDGVTTSLYPPVAGSVVGAADERQQGDAAAADARGAARQDAARRAGRPLRHDRNGGDGNDALSLG
jgi:hypothetical protein